MFSESHAISVKSSYEICKLGETVVLNASENSCKKKPTGRRKGKKKGKIYQGIDSFCGSVTQQAFLAILLFYAPAVKYFTTK